MNDLEERLREAMSASVASARPSFSAADIRRRHRGRSRRIAAVSAVVVVAVVVATATVPPHWWPFRSGSGSPAMTGSARFVDQQFGWTIRYPRRMQTGTLPHLDGMGSDGVRVTNFTPDLGAPADGSPPIGWLRTFPADGVAVEIWYNERDIGAVPPLRDSAFPLTAASFGQARPYVGGSEPRPWYRVVYGDGIGFNAAVWLGPRAGRADRQAAWAIVRSLRFPRLVEGTIWQGQFYVLGPATRYPVGWVTHFPVSSLPRGHGLVTRGGFYLIHAPRAFYVIMASYGPSVSATCSVAYDARHRQFFCPGKKLRWDLSGQPIGKPAASGADGALGLHIATVSQDGHVLFDPFFGALLGIRLIGSPWG